jgi:O-antigen/teichoic acid export membrane protein
MSLKSKALNGVKWTGFSSISLAIIQFSQIVILARILDPSDFGLMALTSVVIGFSALFMDMGISSAIVHKQDITHGQLSSLYWLNIFAGILLCFIIYIIAPYVATFYGEDEIHHLLVLLSLSFIITSVGNQFRILFQKKLQFDYIAKIEVVSASSGLVVAIVCAMNDFGVYSLVYATLTSTSVANIAFLITGLKFHKPNLYFKYHEIKTFISFGLFQIGERSINYFNSQFDTLLIGKILGAEALGIYHLAKNLAIKPAQIINPIINRVAFPVMATIQDDTLRLKNIYLRGINYLCSINFIIYLMLFVLAEPVVFLLVGEKWGESVIILQILSLYFLVRSTGNPVGSLVLAKGRADLSFYWNLGLFYIIPISIYVGSFKGVVGVAISLVILQLLLSIPNWYFLVRPLCKAKFQEYFIQILKPLLLSLVSVGTSYLIVNMFSTNHIIEGILFSMMSVLLYVLLSLKFNNSFLLVILSLVKRSK